MATIVAADLTPVDLYDIPDVAEAADILAAWAAGLTRYGDASVLVDSSTVLRFLPEDAAWSDVIDEAGAGPWTDDVAAYLFRERMYEHALAEWRAAGRRRLAMVRRVS